MKRYLSPIIDKLQATFPPNRLMLIFAGPIVAVSAWISALITSNIPTVELPVGVVSGIVGGAVLVAIILLYKWFDQWQAGEPINVDADLEAAFDEIVAGHQAIDALIGNSEGVGKAIETLRERVGEQTINQAEIVDELFAIAATLDVKELLGTVAGVDEAPGEQVPSTAPADAAPPTAVAAE